MRMLAPQLLYVDLFHALYTVIKLMNIPSKLFVESEFLWIGNLGVEFHASICLIRWEFIFFFFLSSHFKNENAVWLVIWNMILTHCKKGTFWLWCAFITSITSQSVLILSEVLSHNHAPCCASNHFQWNLQTIIFSWLLLFIYHQHFCYCKIYTLPKLELKGTFAI